MRVGIAVVGELLKEHDCTICFKSQNLFLTILMLRPETLAAPLVLL